MQSAETDSTADWFHCFVVFGAFGGSKGRGREGCRWICGSRPSSLCWEGAEKVFLSKRPLLGLHWHWPRPQGSTWETIYEHDDFEILEPDPDPESGDSDFEFEVSSPMQWARFKYNSLLTGREGEKGKSKESRQEKGGSTKSIHCCRHYFIHLLTIITNDCCRQKSARLQKRESDITTT